MFFYDKKLLRQAGYDDAFIEAMPERTLSGDLTMDGVIDIAKQVVDKTDAQYGILHRPNKGPDYIMVFQSYGNSLVDPGTGNLLLERDKLAAAFGWFERGVKEAVIPPTTPRWNSMHSAKSSTRGTRRSGCTASGTWAPTRFQLTGCRPTRLASSPTGDGSPHRP